MPVGALTAAWWQLTVESLRLDVVQRGVCDMTGTAALVWFKRDLRLRDHAPLAEAMHFESALGLVVIEPQWLASPKCDPRHVGFLIDCVAQLQRDLAARGLPLLVRTGASAASNARRWLQRKTSCTACARLMGRTPRQTPFSTSMAHEKVACRPPQPRIAVPRARRMARANCSSQPRFQHATIKRSS